VPVSVLNCFDLILFEYVFIYFILFDLILNYLIRIYLIIRISHWVSRSINAQDGDRLLRSKREVLDR